MILVNAGGQSEGGIDSSKECNSNGGRAGNRNRNREF